MKVLVYPEKKHEELGARRWQVSWEQLKDYAKKKVGDELTPQQAERQRFVSGILVCVLCGLLYLLFRYWGKI
jgi:hypothetical protein